MNSKVLEGISRAKINLHLAVLGRRGDGYHNISTLMAELELADRLALRIIKISADCETSVSVIDSGGTCSHITGGIEPGKNLISIGAMNYLKRVDTQAVVEFSIVKNIPSGAGLGGGSSNAACAIELIRRALGRERDKAVFSAAAETGSDVPFFLYGGFALASGRGEVVEPVDFSCKYHVILVNNRIHVNTAEAYRVLRRDYLYNGPDHTDNSTLMKKYMGKLDNWKKVMKNDFEDAIFPLYPELGNVKEELYGLGADYAAMTGSGSTVFGVFESYNRAIDACDSLKNGNNVVLTKFAL
ncbi:MAG TPA: 4-(cytidine 5'-diphospho)-2-C-methyl-D-erythritol kinase [Spirochaetota bacterium]|nr:4-(cytidine 5'-diphospho)-2-C-methyl-D-erythritol kinase [Spirochaetota bacterium]